MSMASAMERLQISLRAGSVFDVVVAGPEHGTPLVFHHGSPGSLLLYEPFIEAAIARGLRYVSYSRPGYGDSTRARSERLAPAAVPLRLRCAAGLLY